MQIALCRFPSHTSWQIGRNNSFLPKYLIKTQLVRYERGMSIKTLKIVVSIDLNLSNRLSMYGLYTVWYNIPIYASVVTRIGSFNLERMPCKPRISESKKHLGHSSI